MKFIVQRVCSAACRVDDEVTGSIQKGFMVLIGISDSDTKEIADKMIKKLIGLRIFEDSEGKTNLSLKDVMKTEKQTCLYMISKAPCY